MFLITNFLNESKGTPYGVPCIIFYRDAISIYANTNISKELLLYGDFKVNIRNGGLTCVGDSNLTSDSANFAT